MWNLIVTIGVGARDVKERSRRGTNHLFPLKFHYPRPEPLSGPGAFCRHCDGMSLPVAPTI
jgi:hypothetical protein